MKKSKYTKKDFIHGVYTNTRLKLTDVSKCIDAFLDLMTQSLEAGSSIEIRNFGSFEIKKRQGRKGLDLHSGEIVKKNDTYTVVFKPGKKIKEGLNKKRRRKNEKEG